MTIEKLKDSIIKSCGVEVVIFVCGHEDGFRCQCHYDLTLKVNGGAAHKRVTSSKRLLDPIDTGEEDPIMFEMCKEEPIHPNTSVAQARATSVNC